MARSPKVAAGKKTTKRTLAPRLKGRALSAVPDTIDFRDHMFVPTLVEVPPELPLSVYKQRMRNGLEILDQGEEGACTGFALSAVAHFLLWTGGRRGPRNAADRVSPWMLYEVARRYDEWPGEDYEGSSARGAMKGWHKHGVCALGYWKPGPEKKQDARRWPQRWSDARHRPLGAYFRVNHRDLVAMHAALTEVGILYATAEVHAGWDEDRIKKGIIPFEKSAEGGHAFAIVGYDAEGFWVQNSWGPSWGMGGFARVSYDDWLKNGSDVWVARLGAPVRLLGHQSTSVTMTSAARGSRGYAFCDLRPHIVSIGNDGRPLTSGTYGTSAADIEKIVADDVRSFVSKRADGPVHLLLYAHGGLVGEDAAIQRVADVLNPLTANRIYPLSFIWKTDYWTTLRNILADTIRSRRAEGIIDNTKDFMLDRLDDLLEPVARLATGKSQWDEMKENALLATTSAQGGARVAAAAIAKHLGKEIRSGSVQLHLVGHSAGSIFLAPLARLLASPARAEVDFDDLDPLEADAARGLALPITTCTLWAPACTVKLFEKTYRPLVEAGGIRHFGLFTLTDKTERDDDCAQIYHKSLLYLVSHAFEKLARIPKIRPRGEPILGMATFVEEELSGFFDGVRASWVRSPNQEPEGSPDASRATAHGAFDNDQATLKATMARILSGVAARKVDFNFRPSAAADLDTRRSLEQASGRV
jgi:hypothetical protein